MNYMKKSKEELKWLKSELEQEHLLYKSRGLSLDLSRGKPNGLSLDPVNELVSAGLTREECFSEGGFDCRNYGLLDGVPEMKRFFGELLGLDPESILIGGNSSLQLMFDTLMRAMVFGTARSERPFLMEEGRKWLCITPGYDRHFAITERLGFELVSVPMTETGPDMDKVEELVRDPKVKGIWCVPKYSNPTGNTYSDDTVRRLAKMECAAPDFMIMWDNAYAIHDLGEEGDTLLDIFAEAKKYGTEDRIYYFTSTSKVTFPGAGVAMIAVSPRNMAHIKPILSTQTIGYDKLNQLRHLKFLKNPKRVRAHMLALGEKIREKFDIVLDALEALRPLGIAEWTTPRGGYFISLDVLPGTASRVYALMKEAGVTLTSVGATYPYGRDPEDKNLRLAPTYPSTDELKVGCEILTLCVKLAATEALMR